MDPPSSRTDPSAFGESAEEEKLTDALLHELRIQSQSDREIFASLQDELRRIARSKMRSERPDHTLQPTALINEAFIRLFKTGSPNLHNDQTLALRLIARAMDRVLIDYAKARNRMKRGGGAQKRVPLDDQQAREFGEGDFFAHVDPALLVNPDKSEEILDVNDAIQLLRESSPREAEVMRLTYFQGLTHEEIAAILNVSPETIKRDVHRATPFIKAYLSSAKG